MASLKEMILSNEYADYIFKTGTLAPYQDETGETLQIQALNDSYSALHINRQMYPPESLAPIGYSSIPSIFTLTSTVSLEKAGILQVAASPSLSLDGSGVLLGFLDTGIDYRHPCFLNENGQTRILRIWDQTIQTGNSPQGFFYGSEYGSEAINQALSSDAPYQLVPSKDENGHGTAMAGIAGGSKSRENSFQGAAPKCSLAMVKLKEAKPYLLDYYQFNPTQPVYQETDVLLAIRYLHELAQSLSLPLILCIAIGTNHGSHNGNSQLDYSIQGLKNLSGLSTVVAAGNESGKQHHYFGTVPNETSYQEVEIEVLPNTNGYSVELWGMSPEIFSVGAVSPLGEVVERIPARFAQDQKIQLILERTTLRISYYIVEATSGEMVIRIRFENPTPGIWRIRVYCADYISGHFHMYLPISGMEDPDVRFLIPDPYSTIVVPGNSPGVITSGTYDAYSGAIYVSSSRGFTPTGLPKPDFVSPGVTLTAPDLNGRYQSVTGSGAGAALTAGVAGLMLQWGNNQYPPRNYGTNEIKAFLIRGALRDKDSFYPNREWGYGRLNAYQVFASYLNP